MKTILACCLLLAAGIAAAADAEKPGKVTARFALEFLKRIPASEIAPAYDPKLPGFRLEAEIATVRIRPLAGPPPARLVLRLRTSRGLPPMLEGLTLHAPDRSVTTALKLATEEIRTTATPGRTELKERSYFEIKVVGDEVEIVFLPKAMALLRHECTLSWVDWYRR